MNEMLAKAVYLAVGFDCINSGGGCAFQRNHSPHWHTRFGRKVSWHRLVCEPVCAQSRRATSPVL